MNDDFIFCTKNILVVVSNRGTGMSMSMTKNVMKL